MEPAICASSIAPIVGDLGARFMLHPETMAAGERAGQPNGFSFYMAGRGGVLGDVDADVVYSAFMFFNPVIVAKMWNIGVAVAGASAAATSYAEACAQWGRTRLADLDGVGRLADLLARINSGADSAGLSLFAGWRAVPLPDDDPGRAYQSIHVLRELRGSIHVAATVAAGLTGLDAVLVGDDGGEAIAKLHGWPDATLDPERTSALRAKWERAEADTSARMSDLLARTLDGPERSELVALLSGAAAAIAARP
jgi:hypothetical protein